MKEQLTFSPTRPSIITPTEKLYVLTQTHDGLKTCKGRTQQLKMVRRKFNINNRYLINGVDKNLKSATLVSVHSIYPQLPLQVRLQS